VGIFFAHGKWAKLLTDLSGELYKTINATEVGKLSQLNGFSPLFTRGAFATV
jgi:hypothetical protein